TSFLETHDKWYRGRLLFRLLCPPWAERRVSFCCCLEKIPLKEAVSPCKKPTRKSPLPCCSRWGRFCSPPTRGAALPPATRPTPITWAWAGWGPSALWAPCCC